MQYKELLRLNLRMNFMDKMSLKNVKFLIKIK